MVEYLNLVKALLWILSSLLFYGWLPLRLFICFHLPLLFHRNIFIRSNVPKKIYRHFFTSTSRTIKSQLKYLFLARISELTQGCQQWQKGSFLWKCRVQSQSTDGEHCLFPPRATVKLSLWNLSQSMVVNVSQFLQMLMKLMWGPKLSRGGQGEMESNLKMTLCYKLILLEGREFSLARGQTFTNERRSKMPVTFRSPLCQSPLRLAPPNTFHQRPGWNLPLLANTSLH